MPDTHDTTSNGHQASLNGTSDERAVQKQYWSEHSSVPTIEAMMLDSQASTIDKLERPEVLGLLGPTTGKRVVELGAGIGRFTGALARGGISHLLAIDFMQTSIDENRRANGHLPNVELRVGDVTELQLEAGCCDIVFSNWLLMYLSDAEVTALAANMLKWVTVGGCVFFRESCFKQSGDKARKANPTHYRNPRDYFRIFDSVELHEPGSGYAYFELSFCKCIDTYVTVKKNQNQICWKWTKVVAPTPRNMNSFRHFLDSRQYSSPSIMRYQRIFGQGFMSPGGLEATKQLSALLDLKPGERVLDVGCGVGGSTYYISQAYNVHVHGLDLSVNNILFALEQASQRSGVDVTFEVADAMTREYAEGCFDVMYSRDVILHIKDKASLLNRLKRWLRPGGRLLITDYCKSAAAPSSDFDAYIQQRGYHLYTLQDYKAALEHAGFEDVRAEDRTEQFEGYLRSELSAFEAARDSFVAGFSETEFNEVVESWKGKLQRAQANEQKWGLFMARKPLS